MKKTKTTASLLMFFCFAITFAQGGRFKEKAQELKSLKVAFITNELSLTPEESAKFWPVYNTFDDKQKELRRGKLGRNKKDNTLDMLTEKEAAALLIQIEENEEELYLLRKKFLINLKTILPSVKIIKLKKAEEDFNRKLLKQYRSKK